MANEKSNKLLTALVIGGFGAIIYEAMTLLPVQLTPEEDKALQDAADKLGVAKEWLYGVMYFESTLNPQAFNSVTGATGLIQFVPTTAKDIGTTTEDLMQMDFTEQIPYVVKYLQRYMPFYNFIDLYLAVFYPAAIKRTDDYQFPSAVAKANPGYAVEGVVTKGGIAEILSSRLAKANIRV